VPRQCPPAQKIKKFKTIVSNGPVASRQPP
jgi:hypothetical protein